jgi:PIN domain nuclease of toxin-antitoxin system
MNLLLDTHLLLWAAGQPDRLSATATRMLSNARNTVHFSVVSLWEIAIKRTLIRITLDPQA